MSSALVWQLIKNNNSFLVKRGRTDRAGAVQFSKECGNLLKVNSPKFSGISNEKSVAVCTTKVVVKDGQNLNKPKTAKTVTNLSLNTGKNKAIVASAIKATRPELASVAAHRVYKLTRAAQVAAGKSKKVVKSTRRA